MITENLQELKILFWEEYVWKLDSIIKLQFNKKDILRPFAVNEFGSPCEFLDNIWNSNKI